MLERQWPGRPAANAEVIDGLVTIIIVRPSDQALEAVTLAIPPMMIAKGIGVVLEELKVKQGTS
jgi:hypothetical protein